MAKTNNIKDFFQSLKKILYFKGVVDATTQITPNNIPDKLSEIDKSKFGSFVENIICYISVGILGVKKLYIDCTTILYSAYTNCSNLEIVQFSDKVISIQGEVFRGCKKLTTVIATPSLKSVGSLSFYECSNLINLENFDNVTSIGTDCFLDSAYISNHADGPIYIGKVLYLYKGETPDIVTLDATNIVTINYKAFDSKSLKKCEITGNKLVIQINAFLNDTNLEEIYIYSDKSTGGVSFSANSFNGCTALKKVYVDEVSWISNNSFDGSNIEEFYFLNNTTVPAATSLPGLSPFKNTAIFYVDKNLVDTWKEVLVDYNIQPYNGG